MATKKQRRRREKLQRHEYEYVVDTEEGEEVVEAPRPARPGGEKGKSMPAGAVVDRRGRVIPPPSWQRVFKRAAIFGPIMFVLLFALGGKASTEVKIVNAIVLILIFIPFSYLTDRLIYRSVQRRQQGGSGR
jgi:hypothetical protein